LAINHHFHFIELHFQSSLQSVSFPFMS